MRHKTKSKISVLAKLNVEFLQLNFGKSYDRIDARQYDFCINLTRSLALNFKILSTLQLQFRQINFYISYFIALLPIAGFFIKVDDCGTKCEIKFEQKTTTNL